MVNILLHFKCAYLIVATSSPVEKHAGFSCVRFIFVQYSRAKCGIHTVSHLSTNKGEEDTITVHICGTIVVIKWTYWFSFAHQHHSLYAVTVTDKMLVLVVISACSKPVYHSHYTLPSSPVVPELCILSYS